MLIPTILIGAAAASAGYGLKKGMIDGRDDTRRALHLGEEADSLVRRADARLAAARAGAADALADLGRAKLAVWDQQMGRFARLYAKLDTAGLVPVARSSCEGAPLPNFTAARLAAIQETSVRAGEVVAAGAAAVGLGALAGVAAYGGAAMLGAASTGTAIATLSGAAAGSATLAWFGGGALTAGGLGMAGGALVLGGVALGPAMAAGGALIAHRARKQVEAARDRAEAARRLVGELDDATQQVRAVEQTAKDVRAALVRLAEQLDQGLNGLQRVILNRGANVGDYASGEVRTVRAVAETAEVARELLECRLLTEQGAVDDRPAALLARGRAVLKG